MILLNNNLHHTYSIEPILEHTTQPDIEALQDDLKIISQDFAWHIKSIARDQLQKLEAAPTNHRTNNTSANLKLA